MPANTSERTEIAAFAVAVPEGAAVVTGARSADVSEAAIDAQVPVRITELVNVTPTLLHIACEYCSALMRSLPVHVDSIHAVVVSMKLSSLHMQTLSCWLQLPY